MHHDINTFINTAITQEKAQIRLECKQRKTACVVSIARPYEDIADREFLAIAELSESQLQGLFPLVDLSIPMVSVDVSYVGLDHACERIGRAIDHWVEQGMPA